MNLYLIEATEQGREAIDRAGWYDCNVAVIVAARRTDSARKIAERTLSGVEPDGFWLDSELSSARQIGTAKAHANEVVLAEFHAG